MSITPPAVSRNTPPAERSNQRAERAPAGDFAALLELAPAPARAPLARAAERHDAHASADRRDERPEASSPRSRHARPGGGRQSAAPGRDAPAPEHSPGRGPKTGDAPVAAPASAAGVTAQAPESVEGAPAAVTAAPLAERSGVDVHLPVDLPVALPTAAATVDPPAAMVATAGPVVPVAVTPVGEPAAAPQPPAPAFAPAGLPLGTVAPDATGPPAGDLAAAEPAAAGEVAPADLHSAGAAVSAAPPPPVAVATSTSTAAPVASGASGTASSETAAPPAGVPVSENAPVERADAGAALSASAEPATTPLAAGTGTGANSAGARDGETAPAAATDEVAEAPAGVPAPAATPAAAAQSVGRGPDAGPSGPHRSVPLERAPRAVAQLLHVASQSGVSHARIALRPVELGGIEIFLQVSPAGLAAQVIADSPEAARMLAQATEDLRRSLAGQNVELVSIDVSTSAEQQRRDDLASGGFVADDRTPDGRPVPRRADGGPAAAPAPSELTTPTVLELPDGLLVDVLA